MGEVIVLILVASSILFVQFVSVNSSCISSSFNISWEGTIQNANYDVAAYANKQDCIWTLNMTKGSKLRIHFSGFSLEPRDGANDECYDYVEIVSNVSGNSISHGKSCGSTSPNSILTLSNLVTIRFWTDNTNAFDGFQLQYKGVCSGIVLNATEGGYLESPTYLSVTSGSIIYCNWTLFTEEGYKIVLNYSEYHVYTDQCSNDYFKVYDGNDSSAGLISSTCDNSKTSDTSSSSNIFIDFSGGESSKFRLAYSVERILPCESNPCQHGDCKNVGYTNFTCECESGYQGSLCSEDVNECTSNPCEHATECLNQVNKYECICQDGYTGDTCNEDIDDCETSPCANEGVCSDAVNGFTCSCVNGYRGSTCNTDPEAPSCQAEQDSIDGSRIYWNKADPNEKDAQSCPEGTEGTATRECVIVSENPLKVEWENPDLSECTSPEFIEIRHLTNELEESPSEEVILETLTILQNATKVNNESLLYPGDLQIATNAISSIATAVGDTDVDDIDNILQLFSESVNNVIDTSTAPAWKNVNDEDSAANTATSLLTSAEEMAEAIINKQSEDGESTQTTIQLKNFDFNIQVYNNSSASNGNFEFGGEDGDDGATNSSISIPASVLDIDTHTEPEFVAFYTARFNTLGAILNASSSSDDDVEEQEYVNGDIVSIKIIGYGDTKFQNLKDSVIIVIKHQDQNVEGNEVKCVFLNEDSTTASTQWNETGCVKIESNDTHTKCACNHLTNFAVLMDVHGIQEELAEGHHVALSVLSYIGGTLSIIGCILSIFIFEFFKLKSDRIRVHENLAGAMAASLVVFLVGIDRTENKYVCKSFAILLHFLLTSMFMWMLVEGIHLYLALVKVFGTSSHIKKYLILGWGVPAVVVAVSVGVFFDKYGSDSVCWLSTEMLLIVFVPTVAIVVILNTAVLIIVVRVMLHSLSAKDKIKGNSQDQETSSIRTSLKAALVLLPLLGLTWVFGFLSVNEYTIIFTYLFAICNSLQGVIFFLFHCLMNIEVKKAYERRYRKFTSATSSMSTTTTSRVNQPSKRHPSVGTDLNKRRTSISSQESYAYDNPTVDTCFDGKSVKRNNEENNMKNKSMKSTPVKMNDIKVGLTTGTEPTDREKGLVEEAKVAMETILEKKNNTNTISGNIA